MASSSSNSTVNRRPKFVVVEVETESTLPSLVAFLVENGFCNFGRDEELNNSSSFGNNSSSSSSSTTVLNRRPKFVIKIDERSNLPDLVKFLFQNNGFSKFACVEDLNDTSFVGNNSDPTVQSLASGRNAKLAPSTTATTSNEVSTVKNPMTDDRNRASAPVDDGTEANIEKDRSKKKKKSGDDGNRGMKQSGGHATKTKRKANDQSNGSGIGVEKRRLGKPGNTSKPSGQNESAMASGRNRVATTTTTSSGISTRKKRKPDGQNGDSALAIGRIDSSNKTRRLETNTKSANARKSQNRSSMEEIITIESSDESDDESPDDGDGSTRGKQRRRRLLELCHKYVDNERKILCRKCPKSIVAAGIHRKTHHRTILVKQVTDHLYTHLKKPIYKCNECPATFSFLGKMSRQHEHGGSAAKLTTDDGANRYHDEIMKLLTECFDGEA